MRLDDGHGTTIDLNIESYQFDPSKGIKLDYSDYNWLMVNYPSLKGGACH